MGIRDRLSTSSIRDRFTGSDDEDDEEELDKKEFVKRKIESGELDDEIDDITEDPKSVQNSKTVDNNVDTTSTTSTTNTRENVVDRLKGAVSTASDNIGQFSQNVDETLGVGSGSDAVRNAVSKIETASEVTEDLSETATRASRSIDEALGVSEDPLTREEARDIADETGSVVSGASRDLGGTANRAVDALFRQTNIDETVADKRFTRDELEEIDEQTEGFLTESTEKDLREGSKAYRESVEDFAEASGQNTIEPFSSVIEGGVKSVGSVGNVQGLALAGEGATEFLQSNRVQDNPFRSAATVGAIGGAAATQAGSRIAKNPVESTGAIAGDLALGAGITKGTRIVDKKARRGSRRIRGRTEVDPEDIADEDVVSGEQRFTEFEEDPMSLTASGVAERSTDLIDESRTERVGGLAEDRNEAILYSASEADLPSDLDVSGPKNRPSDPEGTLFASPRGSSLAFTGLREADATSGYTLIPRPSQFRSKSSNIIETKAPIREAPSDVGPESSIVRERPDEEFDLGEESQFIQEQAEEGVAYIRSPANRTSEGEVLFAEGTRLVEDPSVDTQFTDIDRGVADIRTFRNVSAEEARDLVDDTDTGITEENVFESFEEAQDSITSRTSTRSDSPIAPSPFSSPSTSASSTSDIDTVSNISSTTSRSGSSRNPFTSRSDVSRRSSRSKSESRSSISSRSSTSRRSGSSSRNPFTSRSGASASSSGSSGGSGFFSSGAGGSSTGTGIGGGTPFTSTTRTPDDEDDDQDDEFELEDPSFDEDNLLFEQAAADVGDFFSSSESEDRGSDDIFSI